MLRGFDDKIGYSKLRATLTEILTYAMWFRCLGGQK